MIRSATGYQFAILAILCTLSIFFSPAVRGPYPATHGPATALEATRASQLLLVAMALAALLLFRIFFCCTLPAFGLIGRQSDSGSFFRLKQIPILRC